VTRDGEREVLGLWMADNEGAQFWLSVMNELRNPIVGKTIPRIVF
jgi:transposase-like protein